MDDQATTLLYMQLAILVAALVCSAALIRKAINFHANLKIGISVLIASTIGLAFLAVHAPLYFMSGMQYTQHNLTVDIMMYGTAGLVVIGVIGFAVDHMRERPTWLLVAAAASLAIGLFPFLYRFNQEQLNSKYEISIVQPEPPKSNFTLP